MDYRSIPTTLGRAKLEQAALLQVPLQLTVVEFGDGAGAEYEPTGLEVALRGKVYETAPNMLFNAQEAETWVELHAVIPFDVGGWYLREYGVRDAAGDLIFIGNLPQSFKPIGSSGAVKDIAFELLFDIQNADSVTLKIDPSKVLATRKFVEDWVAQELGKLDHKQSVRYATTGAVVLSGLAVQAGGDWTGALTTGDRVLVKNQANGKDNGIYAAAAGAWLRVADADGSVEVTSGLVVAVEQGETLADTRWQLVTDGAIVLGTTALVFQNVSAGYVPLSRIQATPTDSTYGALLAVGAFGIGAGPTLVAPDLDTMVVPGKYAIASTAVNLPLAAVQGMLEVSSASVAGTNNRVVQKFATLSGSFRTFGRYYNGAAWSAWVEVVSTGGIPTPPQFDNDLSPATTEFIQRALGNYRTVSGLINGAVITAANIGGVYQPADNGSILFPTPASLGAPSGATVTISMLGRASATIQGTGGATFAMNANNIASFGLVRGQTVIVTAISGTEWAVLNNLKYDDTFNSYLSSPGYQKLPSGLIRQWGTAFVTAGTQLTVSLPITFPNGIFTVLPSANGNAGTATKFAEWYIVSTSQIKLAINTGSATVAWEVVGY